MLRSNGHFCHWMPCQQSPKNSGRLPEFALYLHIIAQIWEIQHFHRVIKHDNSTVVFLA
jgi:hypothetical protein